MRRMESFLWNFSLRCQRACDSCSINPGLHLLDIGKFAVAQDGLPGGRLGEVPGLDSEVIDVGSGDIERSSIATADENLGVKASELWNLADQTCLVLPLANRIGLDVTGVESMGR